MSENNHITEDEYRKRFSFNLRRILRLRNMTQKELSDATNISEVTISRYMSGKRMPTFYTMDKIATVLKCSTDDFRCSLNKRRNIR